MFDFEYLGHQRTTTGPLRSTKVAIFFRIHIKKWIFFILTSQKYTNLAKKFNLNNSYKFTNHEKSNFY